MKKIVDYIACGEKSLGDIEETVNGLIIDGYQPFGSFSCIYHPVFDELHYIQAMVKYEE